MMSTVQDGDIQVGSIHKGKVRRGRGLLEATVLIISDIIVLQIAFLATYWLRFHSGIWLVPLGIPPLGMYLIAGVVVSAVFFVLFYLLGLYSGKRNRSFAGDLIVLFKGVVLGSLLVLALAFFLRGLTFSRSFFGLFFLSTFIFLVIGRTIDRSIIKSIRSKGISSTRALLVGLSPMRNRMLRMTVDLPGLAFQPVGWLSIPGDPQLSNDDLGEGMKKSFMDASGRRASLPQLPDIPCLGSIEDVAAVVAEMDIDLVVLTVPFEQLPLIKEILRDLGSLRVDIQFVPDLLALQTSRMRLEKMGDIPFISVREEALSGADRIVKRTFDLVATISGLILIWPVLLIIALLVKFTSPGGIFYLQERIGLEGRIFSIIKFRTMRQNAEVGGGARIATENDDRTTAVGKVLRKYSLDEFPQLWNVIRGEMSLVGPRPERDVFVKQYRNQYDRYFERHNVKCGLTGWAQVHGLRGDTPIEGRTIYDLHYVENWSLARDVKILLMTIGHVVNAENAY